MTTPSSERFQAIRLIALDIDGVLSDGTVSFDDASIQRRVFDIKDGLGLVRLVESGRRVVVISASQSTAGVERLVRLGADPVLTGVGNKLEALTEIVTGAGFRFDEVAYMGDDLPDRDCLDAVGIALAPADAHPAVIARVHYVTQAPGGRGAVREISDLIVDGLFPGDYR